MKNFIKTVFGGQTKKDVKAMLAITIIVPTVLYLGNMFLTYLATL